MCRKLFLLFRRYPLCWSREDRRNTGSFTMNFRSIFAASAALLLSSAAANGVLGAIGKFGIKADTVAFDIWSDGTGKNEAWLMANGTLYSIDLATGRPR